MEIKIQEFRDIAVIAVKGRLDHLTVPQLNQAFELAIDRGNFNMIVDFSQLSFLSSAGIDALLITQKNIRSQHRGEVFLVGLETRFKNVLELTGLAGLFKFFEDVPSALKAATGLPGTSTAKAPPPG